MSIHTPKHHGEPVPDDEPGHLPVEPDQGPSPANGDEPFEQEAPPA